MKITRIILFVAMIGAIILSGCSAAVSTQVVQPAENALASEAGTAYPMNTVSPQSEAYPTLSEKVYPDGQLPPAPKEAPKPQEGKAAISGTIFSFTSRIALADTNFYLLSVPGDKKLPPLLSGPNKANGDVSLRTDSNGQFSVDNVPPGNYYLVVWAPYSWTVAVDPTKTPPLEQFIELKAGDQKALGLVNVSWP